MFPRFSTTLSICIACVCWWEIATAALPNDWPNTPAQAQQRGPQNDTPLHWAAYEGQLPLVKHLLNLGVDVNATLRDGSTPLHLAAYQGQTEIAELLLAHNARINPKNDRGLTPLDWALQRDQQTTARMLLSHNATAAATQFKVQGTNTLSVLYSRNDPPSELNLRVAPPVQRASTIEVSTAEKTIPQRQSDSNQADNGKYGLQLGAVLDKSLAAGMWKRMRRIHPEELDGLTLHLVEVTAGGRLFHRLVAGSMDLAEAKARCAALQQRGQDCLPTLSQP